jgi:hypothetical protein
VEGKTVVQQETGERRKEGKKGAFCLTNCQLWIRIAFGCDTVELDQWFATFERTTTNEQRHISESSTTPLQKPHITTLSTAMSYTASVVDELNTIMK